MNRAVESSNKAFVLEGFDTLFNKRDYVAAERYWSPHYIQHSAHIEPGRDAAPQLPPAGQWLIRRLGSEHNAHSMITLLLNLLRVLPVFCGGHRQLALENLALRQQLAVYKRTVARPRLRPADRLFWVGLTKVWAGWRQSLVYVTPETVLRWQRRRSREYWTQLSGRTTGGRPPITAEIRALITRMATANPLWGAPRIHGELLKIGIDVAERTVSRLAETASPALSDLADIPRQPCSGLGLHRFLHRAHRVRVLFVLVVLAHHRRRVVHFNVTEHPPPSGSRSRSSPRSRDDSAPAYLIRDRDTVYGDAFRKRVKGMGIGEVLTAPHSPWQNPFAERLIGSIRRECLNHVLVLGERHLRRILARYFEYYHQNRTHLALDKDVPDARPIELSHAGRIVEIPEVGGLHHRYVRRAA